MTYVIKILKAEIHNLKVFAQDTKQKMEYYKESEPDKAKFWKKHFRTSTRNLDALRSALAVLQNSRKQ